MRTEIEKRLPLCRLRDLAIGLVELDAATCEANCIAGFGRFVKPSRIGVIVCEHDRGDEASGLALGTHLRDEFGNERFRERWIQPNTAVPFVLQAVVGNSEI